MSNENTNTLAVEVTAEIMTSAAPAIVGGKAGSPEKKGEELATIFTILHQAVKKALDEGEE